MNSRPTTLPGMLTRMYSLSVHTNDGKQHLPIFDYAWDQVKAYAPAEEAIMHNSQAWLNDHGYETTIEHPNHCLCDTCVVHLTKEELDALAVTNFPALAQPQGGSES